ncbi:MAG: DUF6599 family protein [Armatimonadota bacterium]
MRTAAIPLLSCLLAVSAAWAEEGYGDGVYEEPEGGWAPRTKAEKRLARAIPAQPPQGWELSAGPGIFDEPTLYQHIDGAAEFFIDYGFALVATAQYTKEGDEGLVMTVDLYDMQTPEMGFGIYSAHRPPEPQFVEVGSQGFRDRQGIFAYKGRYFVTVAVTNPTAEAEQAMLDVAAHVTEGVKGKSRPPKLLKYLPQEDLLPATIKITAKNVLGQGYLDNAVFALYKEGEGQSRLFFIPEPSAHIAAENFAKYRAFAAMKGQVTGEVEGIGEEAFRGEIPYNGSGIVFRQGKFVGGILRIQDEAHARMLLGKLLENLSKR